MLLFLVEEPTAHTWASFPRSTPCWPAAVTLALSGHRLPLLNPHKFVIALGIFAVFLPSLRHTQGLSFCGIQVCNPEQEISIQTRPNSIDNRGGNHPEMVKIIRA